MEKGNGQTITTYYYENGKPEKRNMRSDYTLSIDGEDYRGKATTYFNKKGDPKKRIEYHTPYSEYEYKNPYNSKYTKTYNKKGELTRIVEKTTYLLSYDNKIHTAGGGFDIKYKYTYDKHGNVTKIVATVNSTDNYGFPSSCKVTTTYKYKKVKVAKKYWKLVEKKEPVRSW